MESYGPQKCEKIKYQSMPELIKEQLMDWIMDGTIAMGDKLNAEELAARLGVSRMPVREALRMMEKSGIVHSIPYVGARVAELQITDIVQIYLMRKALEPLAGYYACKNYTEDKLSRIESIQRQLESEINEENPNAKRIFMLNREFHFEIYELSSMPHLINIISTLWDNLAFCKLIYGRRYAADKNSAMAMLNQHWNYVNKLKNRDAEGLRDLISSSMQNHLLELKEQVSYEIEE